MNDSAEIKNLKALASLAPSKDDALLASSALAELKQKRARRASRTRIIRFCASFSSIAAAIAVGVILINKYPQEFAEPSPIEVEASKQEIIVVNSVTTTEYYTNAGEMRTITLGDGTRITMNALTTIRVPNHFQKNIRNVELVEGEAYFDVAHDKSAPFIVSTADMEIKVLGTEFNVFAYKGHSTKASLIKGSIKAYIQDNESEGKVIVPNESIAVTSEGSLMTESLTKRDQDEISWKDGVYSFENLPFSEIAERLQLYYGTAITFGNDSVSDRPYSGKFRQGDGLTWILDALQKADRFEYTYNKDNNTIIIN